MLRILRIIQKFSRSPPTPQGAKAHGFPEELMWRGGGVAIRLAGGFIYTVIPCPRLPVFFPSFGASPKQIAQGNDFIDGVVPGTLIGMRAVVESGGTYLTSGGEGVDGNLVWLDPTKYDEAISWLDFLHEGPEMRTLTKGMDKRNDCEVSCWAYLKTR